MSDLPPLLELAAEILRATFGKQPPESVSRINTINAMAGRGNQNRGNRRYCAVAWQMLARSGLICREPEPPADGDWWFITPAGQLALAAGDVEAVIRALVGTGELAG